MDEPRDSRPVIPLGGGQILQFPKAGAARQPDLGCAGESTGGVQLSGADLFSLLWQALADMLGTAAAATLLRRAAQRPAMTFPELSALRITRAALEYEYSVPEDWNRAALAPPAALIELVRELCPLLTELTGSVVVTRLAQVRELKDSGLVPAPEVRP